MDEIAVGRVSGDGFEPASAYHVVTSLAVSGRLLDIPIGVKAGMTRRGSGRADHLHLSSVDAAKTVLDGALVDEVTETLRSVNDRWWRLEIDRFEFKMLRYGPGHYHPEHTDMFPGSMRRKVTMIVQLADPGGYAGGDLEVAVAGPNWGAVPRGHGVAVVFPSWTRHRVSRVTAGERWSLAAWGYGPPVR